MRLIKISSVFIGIFLGAIGLIGSTEDVKNWGIFLGSLHDYLDSPYLYFSFLFLGYVVLSFASGVLLNDINLKKSGGVSGREFPANLHQWDKLQNFPIWQIAWLWNGLEPLNGQTENTPAYPTYRRFKEHLEKGLIKGAKKIDGSWLNATVGRQALIDYALAVNEKPKFLFKRERRSQFLKRLTSLFCRSVAIERYRDFSDVFIYVMNALSEQRQEERSNLSVDELIEYQKHHDDYSDAIRIIRHWFESGIYEAVGRKKINGLKYEYEIIPEWKWEFAEFSSFDFKWANEEYSDLKSRQIQF